MNTNVIIRIVHLTCVLGTPFREPFPKSMDPLLEGEDSNELATVLGTPFNDSFSKSVGTLLPEEEASISYSRISHTPSRGKFPKSFSDTFLEEGSNELTPIDENKDVLLHKLMREGNVADVKKMMKLRYGIKVDNDLDYSPIHLAVLAEKVEILDLLIEAKAEINLKTNVEGGGNTSLHIAAEKGLHVIVEKLIKAGAEIAARNDKCYTALHLGAKHGFPTVIRILLSNGAHKDDFGPRRTALHEAVLNGHLHAAKALLSEGVDKEIGGKNDDSQCRSALQMAIEKLNVKMVEILLDSGCDPNKHVDNTEKTAVFSLARKSKLSEQKAKNLTMGEALEYEPGSELETEMNFMRKILNLLLNNKADVKFVNKSGFNVLGYAIEKNCEVTFEILMEKIREEVASRVPGDWTMVLKAEGRRGLNSHPDSNKLNALDLLLDKVPINISIACSLIRLEAYRLRSRFRMQEYASRALINQWILHSASTKLAKRAHELQVKTFGEFWDLALKLFFIIIRCPNADMNAADVSSKYDLYKEKNVYIYYLTVKQYYTHYSQTPTIADYTLKRINEVAKFERAHIMPHKVNIENYAKSFASKMTPIQRMDLEEKFVLLSLALRKVGCVFRQAKGAIAKVMKCYEII